MMNIIVGLIFVVLGVCIVLWPRPFCRFRWGWQTNREPPRVELLVAKATGVVMAVLGLTLALSDYL